MVEDANQEKFNHERHKGFHNSSYSFVLILCVLSGQKN